MEVLLAADNLALANNDATCDTAVEDTVLAVVKSFEPPDEPLLGTSARSVASSDMTFADSLA